MNELINVLNRNGSLVVSSREVAENFEREHKNVLSAIITHIQDLEYVDGLKVSHQKMFIESKYVNRGKEYPEYLINRDGFALLVMGFNNTKKVLQWKLKYIEAFNKMEEVIKKNQLIASSLSPELQVLINLELQQKELKQEIQDMRDVISLDTTSWRNDTTSLVNKMAWSLGGNEHIRVIREESYKLLDARMGVSLPTRLTNKRRRMADEGVSKSRRDKLNCLDIIAEDKKLIEGYVAIIKEMAIKYGVA